MFYRLFFQRHLEEGEVIARIVHKHWFIGLKVLIWPILSFGLSWGLLLLIDPASQHFRPAFLIVAIWSTFSIVWAIRNFLDYYLDAWIITDQGIIDIEWHGWFHRESSRVLYSDIQGVSYEIQGIAQTLLRFGTISVEKISTGSAISMEFVFNPRSVEGLVLKQMEAYMHAKNLKDSAQVQELLATLVANQFQMQHMGFEDAEDSNASE